MQILTTGTCDVEIIAPLKVKSCLSTFENGMSVGIAMPTSAIALAVTGQGVFGGSLTVFGNLMVNAFIAAKPYASLRVATAGGTPSTGTTVGTIGTPGTTTLVQYGFLTNVSVARGTVGSVIF